MADWKFQTGPAPEAADYLAKKDVGGRFSFDWRDVAKAEHATSFVVAKAMSADLLADIHTGLNRAMNEGWTKERFVKELTPILQAKGWWGRQKMVDPKTGELQAVTAGTPRRLRVIYDTNIRMAHAAGRWERYMRTAESRPFLKYHHTPGEHPRPMHVAWDGITLPIAHPFWKTHATPNGWGCKCYITSLRVAEAVTSEADLKAKGFGQTRDWKNKRTGQVEQVPIGIDPGFDYNVGEARMKALAAPAMPEPQRAYVQGERMPAALPDMLPPRRLPKDAALLPDIAPMPQAAFDAFSAVLGVGEGEIFMDAAQVPVVASVRMFEAHDAAGQSVSAKAGIEDRARMAEIFAATLRDPDEIWHSMQSRQDGTSVLVRNVIGSWDVPGLGRNVFTVIFHEGAARGVYFGTSAFAPGKSNKPASQQARADFGHRVGTLVYVRK